MKTHTKDTFEDNLLLQRLLTLHDIPENIYIEGTLPTVTLDHIGRASPRILTVIGSRKHSSCAKDTITHLFSLLPKDKVIIVSGLALGIDSLAHKEALKLGIQTIAIPGSGLGRKVLYPRVHVNLAEEILAKGGVLISELTQDEKANTWTFPARNRIMAALSDAVLIIEAEEKSGTLITARQALELGKDIGVVPGSIFSPHAKGTNMLARDGAHVITSPLDLLLLLGLPQEKVEEKNDSLLFTEEEKLLLTLLSQPTSREALQEESKLPTSTFLHTLTSLEMKGYVDESFGEVRKVV